MSFLARMLLPLCAVTLMTTTAGAQIVMPSGPGSSPPAPAASGMIAKITPQQVVPLISSAVAGAKITPQIKPGDDGTSIVTFPVWGDQVYSAVSLENCEKDNSGCYVLEFFANFGKQPTINQAWIDGWNAKFYTVRVYPLSNGEIVFAADLMILTGVTPGYITNFAGFFKKVVDESSTFKPGN